MIYSKTFINLLRMYVYKGVDFVSSFSCLKNLYEDGYRCIYYEDTQSGRKIYLKNFDSEHSLVVELNDDDQFSQFKSYIDDLSLS